jgi:hypothetical protein
VKFGILAAGVMSVFGTAIQAALGQRLVLALNPDVAKAIDDLLNGLQGHVASPLSIFAGTKLASTLAWVFLSWLQNWVRYIPDKTISAAIALAIVKFGFPLYKRELILGGSAGVAPVDNWLSPVILGTAYIPSFLILLSAPAYNGRHFWVLWSFPLFIVPLAILLKCVRRTTPGRSAATAAHRMDAYMNATLASQEYRQQFPDGLWFATVIASTLFVLELPLIGISNRDLFRVSLNFFCVIYGFLFAMKLLFIMVAQNMAAANPRAADSGPVCAGKTV